MLTHFSDEESRAILSVSRALGECVLWGLCLNRGFDDNVPFPGLRVVERDA